MIRVCVAGVTGWTGSAVAKAVLHNSEFQLVSAVARKAAGQDAGELLGLPKAGIVVDADVEAALAKPADVFIDYTAPQSVKKHVLCALAKNVRCVVGTSGLNAQDYEEIDAVCRQRGLGIVAAGNFSITAALAKHFSLMAAKYLPTWEIIDYADEKKPDAPSGTTRELAEKLCEIRANELKIPIETTFGMKTARGASVAGTQVHSVRLPGYKLSFETLFGLPDERLTIRHDAGASASPYVEGTLLAAQKVLHITGVIRGLDQILFDDGAGTLR